MPEVNFYRFVQIKAFEFFPGKIKNNHGNILINYKNVSRTTEPMLTKLVTEYF